MSPRKPPKEKKQLDDVYKELGASMFNINNDSEAKKQTIYASEDSTQSKQSKQASKASKQASNNSKLAPFTFKKKDNEVKPAKKFKGFYLFPDMIKEIKDISGRLNISESEFAEKVFAVALNNIEIQD